MRKFKAIKIFISLWLKIQTGNMTSNGTNWKENVVPVCFEQKASFPLIKLGKDLKMKLHFLFSWKVGISYFDLSR